VGQWGPALTFDGNDDYALASSLPLSGGSGGALTLSVWARADTTASALGAVWRFANAQIAAFGLYQWSDNHWLLYTNMNTVDGGAVVVGQWYHLVVVQPLGAGDLEFWIDGAIKGTAASSRRTLTTTDLYIGSDEFSQNFAGTLDDVRVYDTALTAGQIAMLRTDHWAPWAAQRRRVWTVAEDVAVGRIWQLAGVGGGLVGPRGGLVA
jgi:hypothetical protein